MHLPRRCVALLATSGVLVLAACSAAGGPDRPTGSGSAATPSGSLVVRGFYDSASPPPPEGTITPRAGSWAAVHPPAGYRAVLLTTNQDAQTRTLSGAVAAWATSERVRLTTVVARSGTGLVPGVVRALSLSPDLVISTGEDLVDPLATVTASHLAQQFLVVGAELAEPTGNVTAADWAGASFRGEGLGKPHDYDPATFTAERGGRAVRAGVASVLQGLTGIVVRVA